MVKIHLKNGEESVFLYETVTSAKINDVLSEILSIYNFRTKIINLCSEIEDLLNHGVVESLNSQECIEGQFSKIELKNNPDHNYEPLGGYVICNDPLGKRCGKAPVENMKKKLLKSVAEAKAKISREQIDNNLCLTKDSMTEILENLKKEVFYTYPYGLPFHDPIQKQLENIEELLNLDIFVPDDTELWWANKVLQPDNKLSDYIGQNEKTKIIVKIQKKGCGPPPKEKSITEDDKKALMSHYYRRQQDLDALEDDDDSSYLNSKWANNNELKQSFLGLKDVQFRPK